MMTTIIITKRKKKKKEKKEKEEKRENKTNKKKKKISIKVGKQKQIWIKKAYDTGAEGAVKSSM